MEARGDEAGVLHAYDACNLADELYNSNQSGARDAFADNKFITPMIANGSRVFAVGTLTGVTRFRAAPPPSEEGFSGVLEISHPLFSFQGTGF